MGNTNYAITGRFQPFHLDHWQLVQFGLSGGGHVVIGITNPDIHALESATSSPHRHRAEANPFTFVERAQIITSVLDTVVARDRYAIVAFPLDAPHRWPALIPLHYRQLVRVFSEWERDKCNLLSAGGYPVQELPADPRKHLSATAIREAIVAGRPWRHWMHPAAADVLESFGERRLRQRCGGVAA